MRWDTGYGATSGLALIVGFAAMLAGALLFISRPEGLAPGQPGGRLIVERALLMVAVVLNAVGLLLLAEHLGSSHAQVWARSGAYLYLIAAGMILTAEGLGLSGQPHPYPLVVGYVVLALIAQAAVGVAIVRSGSPAQLLGWIVAGWNLAFLIILPTVSPRDMYFPVVHHLMPLAIGISLLSQKIGSS